MRVKGKKIINYSWKNLREDTKKLCGTIKNVKFLLIITKGGLIPGYFIADGLGIKLIETIEIINLSGFKHNGLRGPVVEHKILGITKEILNPKDWLIIDDYSDSGHTLEYLKRHYPGIRTAVLIQNKQSSIKADYFAREVDDVYVKMPYETT